MMQSWRESDYDKESVSKNLAAMESFAQKYPKIKMYFMLAPNAQEIYSDTLPANCGAADQKLFIKDCYDSVPSITGIDVYSALSSAKTIIFITAPTTTGQATAHILAIQRQEKQ